MTTFFTCTLDSYLIMADPTLSTLVCSTAVNCSIFVMIVIMYIKMNSILSELKGKIEFLERLVFRLLNHDLRQGQERK